MKFRILSPEKLKAKARAKVAEFQAEKAKKILEEKVRERAKPAPEPAAKKPEKAAADGVDKSTDINVKLLHAMQGWKWGEAEKLIRGGASLDGRCGVNRLPMLHYAIEKAPLEVIRALVEKGADINQQSSMGRSIARDAAFSGNAHGWTPLMVAIENNRRDVVEYLLDQNPDLELRNPNQKWTALDTAEWEGSKEIFDLLKSRGAKRGAELP